MDACDTMAAHAAALPGKLRASSVPCPVRGRQQLQLAPGTYSEQGRGQTAGQEAGRRREEAQAPHRSRGFPCRPEGDTAGLGICTTSAPRPAPRVTEEEMSAQSTSLTSQGHTAPPGAGGRAQPRLPPGQGLTGQRQGKGEGPGRGFQDFLLKINEISKQEKLICLIPFPCTPWVDPSCSLGLALPTHQPLAQGEG